MTRNQKYDDASSMKRINTCDIGGVVPWSNLNHDVLLLVMMQLGVVEYLSFNKVCKSWRSFALANRNKFMASRPPMSISISTDANEKKCYLEDSEGRKFKTTFPHSTGRICVGLTCGYLILFDKKGKDFWLVNPITRHELHFSAVPSDGRYSPKSFRAILVFSPLVSERVLVVFGRNYDKIWFCIAGQREWSCVLTCFRIRDLHAFKGKLYALHSPNHLSEVRLYPTPEVTSLEIKSFPEPHFNHPVFVSSGENLYVMDRFSDYSFNIHEINFGKMECVSCEETGEEFAFFFSISKNVDAVVGAQLWADFHSQYRRYAVTVTDEGPKRNIFFAKMWYFFHECLNVNLLHE